MTELVGLRELIAPGVLGSLLMIVAAVLGWAAGANRAHWPVRAIGWWVNRVVRPLLAAQSWWRRVAVIALNNSVVCAVTVGLGATVISGWFAVLVVGLSLGIALRELLRKPPQEVDDSPELNRGQRALAGLGVGLNLLEVPAISLTAGLCLSQAAWGPLLTSGEAWAIYGWAVLPALVLAASGEALWMSVYPLRQ
ncbi:MAG: hypothetical protein GY842_22670 [bacterium]|nr:hypothetical protein [bacterium]